MKAQYYVDRWDFVESPTIRSEPYTTKAEAIRYAKSWDGYWCFIRVRYKGRVVACWKYGKRVK